VDGVQSLTINSLHSAWTSVLAAPPESQEQAKGDPKTRPHHAFPAKAIISMELIRKIGQVNLTQAYQLLGIAAQ
jgi:hypothetical protein